MMITATRSSALDELGDPNAPPGSRAWAVAVRLDIQTTLNDINGDASHLKVMIGLIRDHKGYRQLTDGKGRPFATYEAFCIARPPCGLGLDPRDLETIIQERAARSAQERAAKPLPLGMNGRPPRESAKPDPALESPPIICQIDPGGLPFKAIERPKNQDEGNFDIIKVSPSESGGTSADYLTARIARDATKANKNEEDRQRKADILERMKAGEFRSVRAAALAAGIVRPTATFYTDRPEDAARAILKYFQGDRLDALIKALEEGRKG